MKKFLLKNASIIMTLTAFAIMIPQTALGATGDYAGLQKIINFINFIIGIIRFLSGGFAALVIAQVGWTVLTSNIGWDHAKKNLQNAFLGLCLIFGATFIGSWITNQASKFLL